MGLCPSNMIAAAQNPGRKVFNNLARRVPEGGSVEIFSQVDAAVEAELTAAGIKPESCGEILRKGRGDSFNEVPTKFVGSLCLWGFNRAWHYWRAKGPGVPPDKAEEFHKTWGTQVRVAGHCGCPSPIQWYQGFAVGDYHIDTQDGLNAFCDLLRSIYIPKAEAVRS